MQSDPRQRCKVLGHSRRLATHYSNSGHFCEECAARIKARPAYGGADLQPLRPAPTIDLEKESPVEMRKSLLLVELYRQQGIRFVAVPAYNVEDKDALILRADGRLGLMVAEAEKLE